ncbi:hypothetical protein Btru_064333 [Bulinus truncatus]|nr:hypothetical protein Btru_064333 [Bulinus truncatus]
MEATTPGVDRISGLLTWSTVSVDADLSFWTIGDFNGSNISLGVYGEEEGTDGGKPGVWDDLWRGIPLGIVLAFLCLLTTVGNILVLHAVRTEKRLQSVSVFTVFVCLDFEAHEKQKLHCNPTEWFEWNRKCRVRTLGV